MVLPINSSDLVSYGPKYNEEVEKLTEKLRSCKTRYDECELLEEFAKNFTVLPKLWIYWYRLEESFKKTKTYFASLNNKHFENLEFDESQKKVSDLDKFFYKNYSFDQLMVKLNRNSASIFFEMQSHTERKKVLNFDDFWDLYEQYSIEPVNEKRYKNLVALFPMLSVIARNGELWIKYLRETKDHRFIVKSCEYRLADNPNDEDFWHEYFKYLKETADYERTLKTFSTYCRLFLNDYYTHDEYFVAICKAKLPNRLKWWTDYITLTRLLYNPYICNDKMKDILIRCYGIPEEWNLLSDDYDKNMEIFTDFIKNKEPLQPAPAKLKNVPLNYLLTSFSKTPTPQQFPFKGSFMNYILDNASTAVHLKLQMTCKYFLSKNSNVYCHRLVVSPSITPLCALKKSVFFEHSLMHSPKNLYKLNNLHITNSLVINHDCPTDVIPKLISKTLCFSMKYLTIFDQTMTSSEFDILTESGKLKYVYFDRVKILLNDMEEKAVPIEEIIEKLPNVTDLTLKNIYFADETAKKLAALSRPCKFKQFCLTGIPTGIDANNFGAFIKNNYAPNATFRLCMNGGYEARRTFEDRIKFLQKSWEPPSVNIAYF
jgi:hypothetical protein